MVTEPFLKTDRIWYVNYIVNTIIDLVLQGREVFNVGKLWLPLHFALSILVQQRWGVVKGFALLFVSHCVVGVYYFTLPKGTKCITRFWGIAQLHSSCAADWSVICNFSKLGSIFNSTSIPFVSQHRKCNVRVLLWFALCAVLVFEYHTYVEHVRIISLSSD
jgi:hypothetical protein